MSYDFFSGLKIIDKADINKALHTKGVFRKMIEAPWTLRGQVLATGKVHYDKDVKLKWMPRQQGFQSDQLLYQSLLPAISDLINQLPSGSCGFKMKLELKTPFHSRDDLSFYPIDNPLRRDHIFHVPYLSAAGVKGLLRWAWRMCWEDKNMKHEEVLFGQRAGDTSEENARQGCLYTWPIFWDGQVGFEVINPQDREKCAGKDPVKYEVVKAGATGDLFLLLLRRPGLEGVWQDVVKNFTEALNYLLSNSGLSAKRTADWGQVEIFSKSAWISGVYKQEAEQKEKETDQASMAELWQEVCDENGQLLPVDDRNITKRLLSRLTGKSEKHCAGKRREKAYRKLEEKYEKFLASQEQKKSIAETPEEKAPKKLQSFKEWDDLVEALGQGGGNER